VALVALSLLVNANPYGISKTSGFGQVHYRLGIIARQAGKIDDALAEYRRSIEYDPDYAPARMNLAEILLAKQDLDGALVELRETVRIDPEYGRARYNLGLTLALLGDWAAASAEFEESARLAPQSADGWFGAGAARFVGGDFAGARAAFETMGARASAAEAAASSTASAENRASALAAQAAHAAAERARNLIALVDREADLERAAPIGSSASTADSPRASGADAVSSARRLARVASLWLVAGDPARAAAVAQSIAGVDDPVVVFHRGDLLVAMRRIEDGEALLRRALALEPRLPHAHASLAAARRLAGDRYGAYQELEAELETNPANQEARRLLDEVRR
jgi:tetratricopeptide (TPR) repeat protein